MHKIGREGAVPFAGASLPRDFEGGGVECLPWQDKVVAQFFGPAGFDELEKA